jgi:peptide/nickel transport system permease protein
MTAYIIRRLIYAVPILIGVNLITFFLFFFVNTPDDMARAHLGTRRVSIEQIAKWKRERDYHLPYFLNSGWNQIGVREVRDKEVSVSLPSDAPGSYRMRVEVPSPALGTLSVMARSEVEIVGWPPDGRILDLESPLHTLDFSLAERRATQPREAPEFLFSSSSAEAPMSVVTVEFKESLGLAERITSTIFWKKSVRYLLFQFGKSDDGRDIGAEILIRIGPSLAITVPTFLIGVLVNIAVAMMVAFFRGTYLDFWGVVLAVTMMSISVLFYVIGAQWLLGKTMKLVPISGFDSGIHAVKFAALPVIIGVIGGIGGGVRFYRTFFLEEIGRDYVRTARAKGLPESLVLFKHVLKNAMIPILTGVVVTIPFLIIGSLILESFYAIPGMGSFTLEAIQRQDFAIVQAMVFLGSVVYVIGLILTDLSYTLVDPRIRFS